MGRHHDKTFPGETAAYREARDRLLDAEIDLRARIEAVAEQRRGLPLGGRLAKEYEFEGMDGSGRPSTVSFSSLFASGKDTLVLYSFMYGPDWEKPCPLCTSMLDALEGNAAYVKQRANLAVVAKAPIDKVMAWARERGWSRLPLLSSANSSFNVDYNAEFESSYGNQHPVMHVFVRRGEAIHHSWSSEMLYANSRGNTRHVDLMWPLWNVLDLTPEGRGGDFYPQYEK